MDLIKKLSTLPSWIYFQGVTFELRIFNNGPNDFRLCYCILMSDVKSKHRRKVDEIGCWNNPFRDNSLCGFLYLQENIANDKDFINAINRCNRFIKQHNLNL